MKRRYQQFSQVLTKLLHANDINKCVTEILQDILNETKKSGGRVICVGTTSCRTIESLAKEDGTYRKLYTLQMEALKTIGIEE